jgi:hypothetical protein
VLLEACREDFSPGFHTTHAAREKTYPGASTRSQCFSCLQPNDVDMGTLPSRKFVDCLQEETVVKELVEKKRSVEEDE